MAGIHERRSEKKVDAKTDLQDSRAEIRETRETREHRNSPGNYKDLRSRY